MRNLIAFIWKHHFFILFILLEIVCFVLLTNHSNYQRASIVKTTNGITGSIYGSFRSVTEYFSLKQANKKLALENAYLKNRLDLTSISDSVSYSSNPDSMNQHFHFMVAKVIGNSTGKRNNYIILNKGKKHGVSRNMAVVTHEGVVGIVIEVSQNYSSVMSILHKESRISAKIKNNNHLGTVVWEGVDYKKGTLLDIPAHVLISKGDTVITSGFSHIFPEAIPIGIISNFSVDEASNFYTIDIEFTVDYNRLTYVELAKNFRKQEIKSLEDISLIE